MHISKILILAVLLIVWSSNLNGRLFDAPGIAYILTILVCGSYAYACTQKYIHMHIQTHIHATLQMEASMTK